MSDKKLTKGTYYSCSHQKLANSKCNTCKSEQERERERESNLKQEYEQKWARYQVLAGKNDDLRRRSLELDPNEKRELDNLVRWGDEYLCEVYWNGSMLFSSGTPISIGQSGDSFQGCSECGDRHLNTKYYQPHAEKNYKKGVDYGKLCPMTDEYHLLKDCYVKGDDNPTFTCVKHKGDKKPNEDQVVVSAILTYFQKHSIKSIKLENNKLIIKFSNKNKEEKTEEPNNTELKQIRDYIQNHSQNNSLSLEELQATNSNTEKPFNWTPWIIGGSIVVGLILLAIIISSRKRKKA